MDVYDSLAECPLDEPSIDGDDDLVPGGQGEDYIAPPEMVPLLSLMRPQIVAVPFHPVKQGDTGLQVRALKRALSRAGYIRWAQGGNFTLLFGEYAVRALKKFQKDHQLEQTGRYARVDHVKLARFYDDYSIKYILGAIKPPVSAEETKRNAFLAQLMYLYNRRYNIRYAQSRPFDTDRPPWGLDCSASGEWAAKWSNTPSLSGYSSYGYGNTDTQLDRFRRLGRVFSSISQAELCDPLYYGRGSDPSHVAFYIGATRVWSFGSFPIKLLPYDYRHDRIAICSLFA